MNEDTNGHSTKIWSVEEFWNCCFISSFWRVDWAHVGSWPFCLVCQAPLVVGIYELCLWMSPSGPCTVCLGGTSGHSELGHTFRTQSFRAAPWWSRWQMASLDCEVFLCLKEEKQHLWELRGQCCGMQGVLEADMWTLIMSDGDLGKPRLASVNALNRGSPFGCCGGTAGNPLIYGRVCSFFQPHFIIQKTVSFFANQLFSLPGFS